MCRFNQFTSYILIYGGLSSVCPILEHNTDGSAAARLRGIFLDPSQANGSVAIKFLQTLQLYVNTLVELAGKCS